MLSQSRSPGQQETVTEPPSSRPFSELPLLSFLGAALLFASF